MIKYSIGFIGTDSLLYLGISVTLIPILCQLILLFSAHCTSLLTRMIHISDISALYPIVQQDLLSSTLSMQGNRVRIRPIKDSVVDTYYEIIDHRLKRHSTKTHYLTHSVEVLSLDLSDHQTCLILTFSRLPQLTVCTAQL